MFLKLKNLNFLNFFYFFFFCLSLCLFTSCVGKDYGQRESFKKTLKPLSEPPSQVYDDLGILSLYSALGKNIHQLKKEKQEFLDFGFMQIKRQEYIWALVYLMEKLKESPDQFLEAIGKNFDFYAISRDSRWKKGRKREEGEVFITSYYTPIVEGSSQKTKEYSQPLYKTPKDLVRLRWEEFERGRREFERRFLSFVEEGGYDRGAGLKNEGMRRKKSYDNGRRYQRNLCVPSTSWGRVVEEKLRVQGLEENPPVVVPFYDRKEIDEEGELLKRGLEWAWVKPLDAFFLQIQGSGIVEFKNRRRLYLGYHSQNGHPYVAIGKFVDIPIEEMSMLRIQRYLSALSHVERQKILNLNPSYVFFKKLKGQKAVTSFGTEVINGRTIATDAKYFPKGTLAYLEFEKPFFLHRDDIDPLYWQKTSRFVLDQDTGGAIRGPHRVDLFWGEGFVSGLHAGIMKNKGKLYYLVPKASFLSQALSSSVQ